MPARIHIDGNLVADPDFGVGDSGVSWAHLRIASHERVRRDGEWASTDPEFYGVTLFGPAADHAANELHKGDRVTVQGRPELETFDRRDGTAGAAIKVYARTISRTEDPATAAGPVIGRDTERATGEPPVIHHTAESTAVVGVARTATALHKTLKEHGFRWSARASGWVLPPEMDPQARTDKANDLLVTLRGHGRELTVTHSAPAPTPEAAPATTTTRDPALATVATAAVPSNGGGATPITAARSAREL